MNLINKKIVYKRNMDEQTHTLIQSRLTALYYKLIEIQSRIFPPTPMAKPVYHYTSLANFIAILKSKELWLSNYAYLNDTSEIKHGMKILISIVDEFRSKYPANKILDTIFFEYEKVFKKSFDIYTLSFCEDGNFLPLWRFYGDDGKGISVGFSSNFLSDQMSSNENEPLFHRLYYNNEKIEELVSNILSECISCYDDVFKIYNNNDWMTQWGKAICTQVQLHTITYLPFIKHTGYEIEDELRITWTDTQGVIKAKIPGIPEDSKFHFPYNGAIRPMAKIPFLFEHIEKIYIGPSVSNQIEVANFFAKIFAEENYSPIIECSDLPYNHINY